MVDAGGREKIGWPERLWVIRHGESAGNVARDRAEAAGAPLIELQHRDADVPLSPLGIEQSQALGAWMRALPHEVRPTTLLASPYQRARQTAYAVAASMGGSHENVLVDERLREKEFGVLDRYTRAGIRARFPELAEQRRLVGKFYFRPPGGESWCDVALRVRSLLLTWREEHAGQRVAVVSHQAVIMCTRFVLEELSEDDLLSADRGDPLANCSLTTYTAGSDGRLRLRTYNDTAAVDASEEAPVTEEPDADEPDAAEPEGAAADAERRARS